MVIFYQGTMRVPGPRRHVSTVLYTKLALFFIEIIWLVIGSYWSLGDYKNCDWTVIITVRFLIGLAWIGVVVFIIMIGEFNPEESCCYG